MAMTNQIGSAIDEVVAIGSGNFGMNWLLAILSDAGLF
jgi:hypothetical protein